MEWIMFVLLVVLLSFFWHDLRSQLRVHHDRINTRLDALSTRLSTVEEHLTQIESLLELECDDGN